MSLALFPPETKTAAPRKRGKPRAADDPAKRADHIAVAAFRLLNRTPVAELAEAYEVSPRTVLRWTAAALRYDDPKARVLRRLAGPRRTG